VLQIVGRRARVSLGAPWADTTPETTIVFVGPAGAMDVADIQRRFDACRARSGLGASLGAALEWMRRR
jgi:hypothetical protein